jgi:hypothetical protein
VPIRPGRLRMVWGAPQLGQPAGAARSRPGGVRQGAAETWGLLTKQRSGYWSGATPTTTVVVVRGVPWWGLVSSAAAPVLMVSGWTVAAGLQPRSFDPVAQPVSVLAALGAADRWVMTLTFVVVGACDFVTGLALRPAGAAGRLMLMAGAVAGMLVAANPEHPGSRLPLPHMIWAAAGCAALVAWPAGARRRGPSVPWGLRPEVSAGAVVVLLALLAWFGTELITGGGQAGLAERIFGAAQAVWPLAVVVSCRRAARTGTRPSRMPGLNQPTARRAVDACRPARCAHNSCSTVFRRGSSPADWPNRVA